MECALCSEGLVTVMYNPKARVVVCRDCRARHDITSPANDDMVRQTVRSSSCIHQRRGCTASPVPYNELAGHLLSCRFVPCACPSRGCTFAAPPDALPRHFDFWHDWPVVRNLVYGHRCKLAAVPEPGSMVALVGEADSRVFVVYAFAVGDAADTAVSVVCVGASEDEPEVAHQFLCKLWVKGGGNMEGVVVPSPSFRLTSCDGPRRLPGSQPRARSSGSRGSSCSCFAASPASRQPSSSGSRKTANKATSVGGGS